MSAARPRAHHRDVPTTTLALLERTARESKQTVTLVPGGPRWARVLETSQRSVGLTSAAQGPARPTKGARATQPWKPQDELLRDFNVLQWVDRSIAYAAERQVWPKLITGWVRLCSCD